MKKWGGVVLIGLVGLITVNLWVMSKSDPGIILKTPWLSLGQITALLGASFLAVNYVLSARLREVERVFGGLDKMYKVHRTTGGLGFILVVYHPIFLAANVLSFHSPAWNYFLPSAELSYTFGVVALYLFATLITLTIYAKLPYRIWKLTHIWMGLPLLFVGLHVWFIDSDISRYMPLRFWIIGLVAVAGAAFVWKRFFYTKFGPHYSYRAKSVRQLGTVTELELAAAGAHLHFEPGQFVFVSIQNDAVGREKHPFSISSAPGEPELRLSIKSLGDYTARLPLVKAGDEVVVYGPYGYFGEKAWRDDKDQVWVAGGIGITPFLSFVHYRSAHPSDLPRATFYYTTRSMKDAPYADEVAREADPGLRFYHHRSDEKGFLTASLIEKQTGDLRHKRVFLCGPKGMMDNMADQFRKHGVPARDIIFEDFSFLT
ncbi:MAG TPA: ferric reductase-like transmembrane domain-containing protein [Candidatus Paceibacterota bacterium]|nr:ferric reductase-like transmembrane domain-containing protein [Candidatus Paceibacterota bacterium]